ncbi:MAG: tripartite tricarboxylate transporter substrate binding protein [Hyphomicrobiales bacterium]|nr:tripartite tricarboxylate transporter substrate binding protein [Hyphomicrobiales bacterium]
MLSRRHLLASGAALAAAPSAFAQSGKFPDRPIRIVVPFPAGGGVDVYARLLAEKVTQRTGAVFVIDNRAGGSGTVGGNAVRTAPADGSMLLFSAATHVMARQVMSKSPYDPLVDFTPIARVGEAPMLLVMAPNREPKTVAELVAAIKKEPDKWTFGTPALGAPGHLATIAFNRAAGVSATILPYRGTAPALTDVAGGHIQLLIDPVLALLPMAREKKVIGLAVTSGKRTRLAPEIPTVAESGLAGFDHASWYGLWGPKALPPTIVATLNQMFNAAVKQLDSEGKLANLGIEPVTEGPEQFAEFAAKYVRRNADLLKAAKFEPA